ncbi:MAG: hypothetical protein ACTSRK_17275 [Promethearchaeota archaeon]
MANTTLEKYKEDLLQCLEKLQTSSGNPGNDKEYLEFLILWLKVRQICLNAQEIIKKNPSKSFDSQTYSSLLKKFNVQIQPKLSIYMRQLKDRPLSERILTFSNQMLEYFTIALQFVKEIPQEAMKVYEQARFFLLIYQFTLDQIFIKRIRLIIFKKMDSLKKAFEIEAGNANLFQEQENLSTQLTSSLKIKPGVGGQSSEGEISPNLSESSSDDILMASDILLPEELPASTAEQVVPVNYDALSALSRVGQPSPEVSQIKSSYALKKWFPSQDSSNYLLLRYCPRCGRVINTVSRQCTGCGSQF